MKRSLLRRQSRLISMCSGVAMLSISAVMAQEFAPGGFDLSWNTIDGGGGTSTGGTFEVSGSIGQPDAGAVMTGGTFSIVGGFWPGSVEPATLCPADIAGDDGLVNIDDLLLVINFWGQGVGAPGDVDHNGSVDIDDLLLIVNTWGACPP